MAFRFQGKNVFLTYAQAENLSSDAIIWALRDKVPTPDGWVCGEENHQDGGKHFHVMVKYETRIDIRDQRFFDVEGYHPNIQSVRSPKNVIKYCIKDGNYISHNLDIPDPDLDIYKVVREEIERGTNATNAIEAAMERVGTKGLRMYNNIAAYIDRVMKPKAIHAPLKFYPIDFVAVDDNLGALLTKFLHDVDFGCGERGNRKSLWLHGQSRMGKTVLARSMGFHWYMMGAWNVDCYDDTAEYGVLDDINWDTLKNYYKGILGLQLDVTVTDKYKKKSVIKGGRPVIIVTNELPCFSVQEAIWLEANVNFYHVAKKVFE